MSTPITQAALDTFKRRVVFKGSTESDLVEGVTDLVASMARLERAHAAEREKVRALREALDEINSAVNPCSWISIRACAAIAAAMKEGSA